MHRRALRTSVSEMREEAAAPVSRRMRAVIEDVPPTEAEATKVLLSSLLLPVEEEKRERVVDEAEGVVVEATSDAGEVAAAGAGVAPQPRLLGSQRHRLLCPCP